MRPRPVLLVARFLPALPLVAASLACSSGTSSSAANDAGDADARDAGAGDAGVACGYTESTYNASASVKATSTATWTCTATARELAANGLPDHATGTFPNTSCPNTIAASTVAVSMPLDPATTGTSTAVHPSGYQLNGVKYDPGTAGGCTSESDAGVDGGGTSCSLLGAGWSWNIEALGQSSFDFGVDSSNAHVQPTGEYHYHGMPEATLAALGKGKVPTLVGFAVDGFPVYARYGYTSPMDATSAVKVMTGSYALKSTPDANRPSTATYPMGTFTEDYTYVAGSGDLDECNGRTDVTPEYPAGTYHYYITDTYPFIQRCVMGTASATGGSAGGGGGGPPPGDGGPPPGSGGAPGH